METLYRFTLDCGRMGVVRGLFVASSEDIDKAIGRKVYFGEILGKHSEIQDVLRQSDLLALTTDQDFISKFKKYGCASGYNPLHYLEDEEG